MSLMNSKIGPQKYHFDVFTKKVVGELGIKRFSKYMSRGKKVLKVDQFDVVTYILMAY